RLIDAAPDAPATVALEEHLHGCEACRRWQGEMRALEATIRRALGVDAGDAAATSVAAPRTSPAPTRDRGRSPHRWAMAAGLLVALAAGAFLWTARPAAALAAEVVAHAEGEPASWSGVVPVPD